MASHLTLAHHITKEEYLAKYPNAKLNSDERIDIQKETNKKVGISNKKAYNPNTKHGQISRKRISDSQKIRQSKIPKEKKSKQAIERNKLIKQDKNKYNNFRKKCSIASRKHWDSISKDDKNLFIQNLTDNWKNWYYNKLSDEDRLKRQKQCHTTTQFNAKVGDKEYNFKSKLEYKIALYLFNHNILFEYETIKIELIISNDGKKYYHYPDFYIPSKNLIIEGKALYKKYKDDDIKQQVIEQKIKEKSILDDKRNFKYSVVWYSKKEKIVISQLNTILLKYNLI